MHYYRKSQNVQDIRIAIKVMNTNGNTASGLTDLATRIVDPSGTILAPGTDYDEATITEPYSKGIYILTFPQTSTNKAFILTDTDNPYTLILFSTGTSGVVPSIAEIWIFSQYPWERKDEIIDYIKSYGSF